MSEPSLAELEAERDHLYAQLSRVGDFRRGSVSENWRRCGKPNCACAAPDHPGHGPRFLWTQSVGRRGTVGRQLAAAEVGKVRAEVGRHAEFTAIAERTAEVNEAICEARPTAVTDAPSAPEGEKGEALRPRAAKRLTEAPVLQPGEVLDQPEQVRAGRCHRPAQVILTQAVQPGQQRGPALAELAAVDPPSAEP